MPMIPRKTRGQAGEVSINLTPMIDATFQLIIFFILTTTFVKAELAHVSIPDPLKPNVPAEEGQAEKPGTILLQAVSKEPVPDNPDGWGDAARAAQLDYFQVGSRKFTTQTFQELVKEIQRRKEQEKQQGAEEFRVEIRADRRLKASFVELLMKAAAAAGIYEMDLKTTRE